MVGEEQPEDDALPLVQQRTRIRLRCGVSLEGEMHWISLDGHKRTSDYVNDAGSFVVLHGDARTTYYVAKAQMATVEEVK